MYIFVLKWDFSKPIFMYFNVHMKNRTFALCYDFTASSEFMIAFFWIWHLTACQLCCLTDSLWLVLCKEQLPRRQMKTNPSLAFLNTLLSGTLKHLFSSCIDRDFFPNIPVCIECVPIHEFNTLIYCLSGVSMKSEMWHLHAWSFMRFNKSENTESCHWLEEWINRLPLLIPCISCRL